MKEFASVSLAIVALVTLIFVLNYVKLERLRKYYPKITWCDVLFFGNNIKIEPDGR